MALTLPHEILAFDAALFSAHHALDPAHLLNPLNVVEAQAAFFAGAAQPPFRYAQSADLLIWQSRLRALPRPTTHPFSELIHEAATSFDRMAEALHHRDADHFDAWARHERWEQGSIPQDATPDHASPPEPALGATAMRQALEAGLAARGLTWRVRWDEIMSARILVESNRKEIRVNPGATFRASDVRRLVAHEIDVHVTRSENGRRQPLRMFSTGLPGSLQTEEGLAMCAEEHVGTLSATAAERQRRIGAIISLARTLGFRELWELVKPEYGPRGAFAVALRIKRGLADPGRPGAYAKDAVYGLGWASVRRWLTQGGKLSNLYVGKVGLHHPIDEWLREGWIQPCAPPAMWDQST